MTSLSVVGLVSGLLTGGAKNTHGAHAVDCHEIIIA